MISKDLYNSLSIKIQRTVAIVQAIAKQLGINHIKTSKYLPQSQYISITPNFSVFAL